MWLYHTTRFLAPVIRPYWRLGLTGAVSEVPREGPLLVASNHASFLDPWLLGLPFPRPIRFLMVRRWYDRSVFWRAFFGAYGCLPVRGRGQATMDSVCQALAAGEVVGIFPEGRISADGRLGRFHSGLAIMAARSGAPVVPVGIRGNHGVLSLGQRVPRPGRVTVHVGRSRRFPGAPRAAPPPRRESREFMARVFEDIGVLADRGPARRGAGASARPRAPAGASAGPPRAGG